MLTSQPRDNFIKWFLRSSTTPSKALALFMYYTFLNHLPDPPFLFGKTCMNLRGLICKFIFKSAGVDLKIHSNVYFGSGLQLSIGSHSNISHGSWLSADTTIGKDVMMGPNVTIISASHEFASVDLPMRLQGMKKSKPVVIEDGVWLGTRSIILPGVTIGAHSIVGAGSVVTKSFPPYSIIAGNPATLKKIRKP